MFGSLLAFAVVGLLVSYYARMTRKAPSHGSSVNKCASSAVTDGDADSPLVSVKCPTKQSPVTLFSTSSLPVEIMLVILSQAIEMPPLSRDRAGWFEQRFSLSLSHVCSLWRAVMMENKAMWTDISVLWDQYTIDLYHTRAGDLPVQYHLVMEGPSSARRAKSWLLDTPVQEYLRSCSFSSSSPSTTRLNVDLQVGGWPGFGRGIIGDNLGRVLERIEAPRLETLCINGIETPRLRITDVAFKAGGGLPSLRRVSLTNVMVSNESAFFYPGLTHLTLYKVQVEWGTLNLLQRLPNLLSLSISPLTVTLVTVATRYNLPCLQSLTLRGPTRDLNTFMGALHFPHTCSIDICLMETMGVDLDKNTSYARSVFATLRARLALYGSIDVFDHVDLDTDPFTVRLSLSQRTQEHLSVPNAQRLTVSLVAFLPNRRFLLNPLLDDQLPGLPYIRTITSAYSVLEGGPEFPHHHDLWTTLAKHTPRLASCVLRGRADNATAFFDALEVACANPGTPSLLRALEEVVLDDTDFESDPTDRPSLLEAGSSFWTIVDCRPRLKITFNGCYIPSEAEEKLSRLGNVTIHPE